MTEIMCPKCKHTDVATETVDPNVTSSECFNCGYTWEAVSFIGNTLETLVYSFVYVTFDDELPKMCILLKDRDKDAYMAGPRPSDMFYASQVVAIYEYEDEMYPHIVVETVKEEVE